MVKNPPATQETWFDSWVGKIRWRKDRLLTPVFLGCPCGSAGKESACNVGDLGSIPGLGRSPGEGKCYPLQYFGLQNSIICGWRTGLLVFSLAAQPLEAIVVPYQVTLSCLISLKPARERLPTPVFLGFPGGSDGKESACNVGNPGSVPGLGRFPGEGNGYPLRYSCLENPKVREAWRATVHGAANSLT